jgi:hypothetical protein
LRSCIRPCCAATRAVGPYGFRGSTAGQMNELERSHRFSDLCRPPEHRFAILLSSPRKSAPRREPSRSGRHQLHRIATIFLVLRHHGPERTWRFMGDGRCCDVRWPARNEFPQPWRASHPFGMSFRRRLRPMYQQGAQVAVTALADPADLLLAATGSDTRCQTEPCGEVTRGFELLAVTDRRHCDGTDAGSRRQALAVGARFMPGDDPRLHFTEFLRHCIDVPEKAPQCFFRLLRNDQLISIRKTLLQ